MKLNVKKFMETEMGGELEETIRTWDKAIDERRKATPGIGNPDQGLGFKYWDNTCRSCQDRWEVFKLAIKQFYGIEFFFTRTDEYFGVCSEDENIWLMKEKRENEEGQAIEKIRKIVEELGENSYVGFAMEDVLELAEENIRDDTAYSMKRSAEIAQEQTDELKEEIKTLKKRNETIHRVEIENKDAAARLSLENERLRKEIKENQIPEELIHECYCMAYDKEAGAQKKMEQAADQMAEAAIKGEDTQSFAKEYQAQKSNRRRYEKIMQQLDKIEKRKAGR